MYLFDFSLGSKINQKNKNAILFLIFY